MVLPGGDCFPLYTALFKRSSFVFNFHVNFLLDVFVSSDL